MKIYTKTPTNKATEIYLTDDVDSQNCYVNHGHSVSIFKISEELKVEPFIKIPTSIFNKFVIAIVKYAEENNIQ